MENITILIDNRTISQSLLCEHGLSIYFTHLGKQYLFDVGASGKFIENANHLGIDISQIDTLILSHGHNDHTGGLNKFLEINTKARIIFSSIIPQCECFSCRRAGKRSIGSDKRPFQKLEGSSRLMPIGDNVLLEERLHIFFNHNNIHSIPKANSTLSIQLQGKESQDHFAHEIGIAANTSNGGVVLSACTHNGLLNTLETASELLGSPISTFIGGTHLVEGDFETEDEISDIAKEIQARYPDLNIHTGHCTCDAAIENLQKVLGKKISSFHSGEEIRI